MNNTNVLWENITSSASKLFWNYLNILLDVYIFIIELNMNTKQKKRNRKISWNMANYKLAQ